MKKLFISSLLVSAFSLSACAEIQFVNGSSDGAYMLVQRSVGPSFEDVVTLAAPKHVKRGRHVAWLLVPILGILCLGIYGWRHISQINTFLSHSLEHMFFHGASAVATAVHLPVGQPTPGSQNVGPFQKIFASVPVTMPPIASTITNAVASDTSDAIYCSGYFVAGTNSMVFLSDGRIAYFCDIQQIRTEKVKVFGEWFSVYSTSQIEKIHPSPTEMNQPSSLEPIPSRYSPEDFDSSVAVLPTDHWQGTKPQVKNNFVPSLPHPVLGGQNGYQPSPQSPQAVVSQ